jgi:hypothetical protein
MARVEWSRQQNVRDGMANYGRDVKAAKLRLAQFFAAKIEEDAKIHAEWQDRTGNARQSLRGYTNQDAPGGYPNPADLAEDAIALYLSHGMDYGVYLETRYAGAYAIILPVLQRWYPEITKALKEIFRR